MKNAETPNDNLCARHVVFSNVHLSVHYSCRLPSYSVFENHLMMLYPSPQFAKGRCLAVDVATR